MLEQFDVQGILAFAERVLPRPSDLWVRASLDQRQRLQHLFFPDGVAFDGKRFVRTGVSTPAFQHLTSVEPAENNLASPNGTTNPSARLADRCRWRRRGTPLIHSAGYSHLPSRDPLGDPQDMLTLRTWTGILLCATMIGACGGCGSSSTPAVPHWADRLHLHRDDDVLHDDAVARTRHALRVLFLERHPGVGGGRALLVDVNAGPVGCTTAWTAISANRDAVQRLSLAGRRQRARPGRVVHPTEYGRGALDGRHHRRAAGDRFPGGPLTPPPTRAGLSDHVWSIEEIVSLLDK